MLLNVSDSSASNAARGRPRSKRHPRRTQALKQSMISLHRGGSLLPFPCTTPWSHTSTSPVHSSTCAHAHQGTDDWHSLHKTHIQKDADYRHCAAQELTWPEVSANCSCCRADGKFAA